MIPKIKICGITRLSDALVCAESGADYLGFVFHRRSPRAISPRDAHSITSLLPPGPIPVGVFVDPERDELRRTVEQSGVRMVQLCGSETPETCAAVGLPVIKVLRSRAEESIATVASRYDVFAFMIEGAPEGSYGGSGILSDLDQTQRAARSIAGRAPLFIAGGLTPDNVGDVTKKIAPFGVDVCSGTESFPGVKDHMKVLRFCSEARRKETQ